jgi:hypothetical protein
MWNLYFFPGLNPSPRQVRHRWQVRLWMLRNCMKGVELRAIHSETREHMVL